MTTMDGYDAITHGAAAHVPESSGHFEITGVDAHAMVNRATTADLSKLPPGSSIEALLLHDDAGIIAAVDVLRFEDRVMLRVDGRHRSEVWQWLVDRKRGNLRLRDISDDVTVMHVIGPAAAARLATLLDPVPAGAGAHLRARFAGVDVFAVRAADDRPDGVTFYCRLRDMPSLRQAVARLAIPVVDQDLWDLVRLEWGVLRVGVEIDRPDTPVEAGLERLVALGKGAPFPGEVALATRVRSGPFKRLVGFRMMDASVELLTGSPVSVSGREFDRVRSVCRSPRLGVIGVTAVPAGYERTGAPLAVVDGDGNEHAAELVRLPFAGRQGPVGFD